MNKTLGDYLIFLLSLIGSIASIVSFLFVDSLSTEGWVGVLFLGIITLFFLFYNLHLISSYRLKSRYSDVFSDINSGFSELNRMYRLDNMPDEAKMEQIISALSSLCDSLAAAFKTIYDHNIGVCIKFLANDKDRPVVKTLYETNTL